MALDIRSPMDLVYECFVKLGLRYVCVTKEGRYAGLVSLPPLTHSFLTITSHLPLNLHFQPPLQQQFWSD
jgi:hypothetical protein